MSDEQHVHGDSTHANLILQVSEHQQDGIVYPVCDEDGHIERYIEEKDANLGLTVAAPKHIPPESAVTRYTGMSAYNPWWQSGQLPINNGDSIL